MPSELERLRQELRAARELRDAARETVARARQRLRRLDAELAALARRLDPTSREDAAKKERLERLRAEAEAALAEARRTHETRAERERQVAERFATLSDPRNVVSNLSDDYPFLLFPVRLETRFKTVTRDRRTRRQLWVRIYPDDCSIDTFEATLSDDEVTSARLYWAALWEAGGHESGERAAWRGLVSSHGSGRAAWIVEQYRPLNVALKPSKPRPIDVILVVPTDEPLPTADEAAAAAFFLAVWLADGDKALEDQARVALEVAVGVNRAADITAQYRAANLDRRPEPPLRKTDVNVQTAFVVFPRAADVPTKRQSWTRAPRVAAFPDRFVLIARAAGAAPVVTLGEPVQWPLIVGPDPSAPETEALRPDGENLIVPDELTWLVDFDRAVTAGMGFRIDLDDAQAARGFDRLLVIGVRASADERMARVELETLIQHHQRGRNGFSLVPQGTPTNNTEGAAAGFARGDDPDGSFDDLFKAGALFQPSTDPLDKRDGQWLAEALGIDPAVLGKVRHSGGSDQREATAMNTALWPATIGYWMQSMMEPVFTPATVEATRQFFLGHVSGRGRLPAVRIGAQPYGVLPVTAFSRMRWMQPRPDDRDAGSDPAAVYLRRLYEVVKLVDADWIKLAERVAHTGQPGPDPHRTLLDIVGLHPGSVEYAQRYAEGLEELFNRLNLAGLGGLLGGLIAAGLVQSGQDLLARLGFTGSEAPDLLTKFFLGRHHELRGPVIDDRPPSETEPIRAYTADGRNYLQWLIDAANTSLDAVRREEGFLDSAAPRALLYVLLRHAVQLGFYDAGVQLHEGAGLFSAADARLARREAPFIHVAESAPRSESRYQLLYTEAPAVTSHPTRTVAEYIVTTLGTLHAARALREQLRALDVLRATPTARLERLLAEHVDCATYRLDAWLLGLVHHRLAALRQLAGAPRQGVYLGAYAWLENLRPESRKLEAAKLTADLHDVFNRPGDPPLVTDTANQGYIHAPSLNHAVTAAVLRNGHVSNASSAQRDSLAVNLTSARVRTALSIVEGLRGGQSLGALLGYQLERGLHDRHGLAEVDKFIYKLRKAFPLRADRLASTRSAPDVPIEAVEARNVVDGVSLVEHVKATGNRSYPFGKDLPAATPNEAAAIDGEVQRLLDAHDAVADLAIAEGVHQAVQGNYDRVAAALNAFGRGELPPDPDVVRTPTIGVGLTHRVGLHLAAGVDPTASPVAGVAMTPRAQAEPALNLWLSAVLPPLATIACKVVFRDAANAVAEREVTLADLGVQPIDLLYLVPDEPEPAMTELDDRVLRHVVATHAPRPDGGMTIRYMEKIAAPLSLFETLPLIRSLRRLALSSRPLRASDLVLHAEATQAQDAAVFVDPARLVGVRDRLQMLRGSLMAFRAIIEGPLADLPNQLATVVDNVDATLGTASDRLSDAARFNLTQTGSGFVHEWRRQQFAALLNKVGKVVTRWDGKLADFDAAIAVYDALPADASDEERFDRLQRAERLIDTVATQPLPATPAVFRAAMTGKRAAFVARRAQLGAIQATNRTTVAQLLADVRALLPVSDVDFVALTLDAEEQAAVTVTTDVLARVTRAITEVEGRLVAAQARLAEHDAAGAPAARVAALQAAAKAMLGDDALVIPEFGLAPAQGDELEQALMRGQSGDLFRYLTDTLQVDFPVDEWLYGVARVRDKLRAWEETVMLAGAFGRPEPELIPLQLPTAADDRWLALEFPPATALDRDRLLYTAAYATAFQKTAPQCGLLLDEWTEVIPGATTTTGIAFHYDRPSNEAPQAMLLVLPPGAGGAWQWADLVDALDETLDLAKRRAVEPVHVDATAYARFLPATIMAVTASALTISANLALNNRVHEFMVMRDT